MKSNKTNTNRIEVHPFEAFIPDNLDCLIVGSFPGKEQTLAPVEDTAWFYGAPRNQFWKILEFVYDRELNTREQKQALFCEAGIGMTDVIHSCIRTAGTNKDENLGIREYNEAAIREILKLHQPRVFFTSRFVEKIFRRLFPDYTKTDILPSPSPRYFRLAIADKVKIYRGKLPGLNKRS